MVRLAGAFAAATVTTVVLSGCGGGGDDTTTTVQPTPKATKSIADLAKATKDLSTLYAAWTASDVSAKLKKDAEYTVFAPTNAAFDAVDKDLLQCLLNPLLGKAKLTQVIENHVVDGAAVAADLKNDQELTTLEGDKVKVSIAGGTVKVGAATVVKADIMATDGVIHEIDTVLVPDKFEAPQCGSCGTIGACAASLAKADPPKGKTLVDALTAAGLVSALEDPATDPATKLLTVFAPTDDAFTAANADGLVTCLLKPENKAILGNILLFHVVPKYVLAADVTDKLTAPTLDGENKLTFGVSKGVVTVMGGDVTATVTAPNLYANNGVTHVIDKVLIPGDFKVPSNCATATTTAKMTTTKKITQNQIQV